MDMCVMAFAKVSCMVVGWFLKLCLMNVDDIWMIFGGSLASTKGRLRMWNASKQLIFSLIILDL